MNAWGSIVWALWGGGLVGGAPTLHGGAPARRGRAPPDAWRVAEQPMWWLGIGVGALGTFCYYAALWTGLLSLVQPLSSLHIVFTAVGMAWLRKEAVLGVRAGSIALVALGVLACLVGEIGRTATATPEAWGGLWFALLLVVVVLAALLLPKHSDRLSIWAGCAYSVSAVSWKGVADLGASFQGVASGMLFGATYVMGFMFMQAAFRRGGAASVNAVATGVATALPMAAAMWIFHEPVGWLTWIGVGLIVAGVLIRRQRRAPAA